MVKREPGRVATRPMCYTTKVWVAGRNGWTGWLHSEITVPRSDEPLRLHFWSLEVPAVARGVAGDEVVALVILYTDYSERVSDFLFVKTF